MSQMSIRDRRLALDTRIDHPSGVPALALCAALLTALIVRTETDGEQK